MAVDALYALSEINRLRAFEREIGANHTSFYSQRNKIATQLVKNMVNNSKHKYIYFAVLCTPAQFFFIHHMLNDTKKAIDITVNSLLLSTHKT